MTTNEFVNILESNANLPLLFEYKTGAFTRMDYHITEIKNVTFDTVDCGGVRNKWQEVHIQLWENQLPEPNHRVNTTKALDIFNVVEKVRATYGDVSIKFEYGNKDFHTAVLPVGNVAIHDNQIIVQLGVDQTSCKAQDRANTPEEKAAACCAPAVAETATKPKMNLTQLILPTDNVCTPWWWMLLKV